MSWQMALAILLLVNTGSVVLTKVAADIIPKKSIGIFYQYLFCVAIAVIYGFLTKEVKVTFVMLLIGAVGFVNAFGNYFQWRASALSLSRTTLFFPMMEVVTIVLAVSFLGEDVLWNPQLIIGAALCFLAMWLFRMSKRESGNHAETPAGKWIVFILGMILIFGTTGFLLKWFALDVPRGTFLLAWYVGAFLAALPILLLEKSNPLKATRQNILTVLPVSFAIWGSLLLLYLTYQLEGPVSLVLPVRGLAITLIPVLIGWWLFRERKGLSGREWIGFLAGVAGAVLVLLR
ncbi:MAG: hypothetical protein Q7S82_00985 [bacterium]|nr:hypothetical protein [bacterium]